MTLFLALVIIVVFAGLAIALMLFLRRHAPAGGRFTDSDRAAGVFGVLGTAFAILLGFVVLLAFDSYSSAKANAAKEATAVADSFQTAELFPTVRTDFQGAVICYARAVIHQGWPAMRDAHESPIVEGWAYRVERLTESLPAVGSKQSDGFTAMLAIRDSREEARRERLSEAGHTVPAIMWVLFLMSCIAPLLFICFWADPDEPALVQAAIMGSVASLIIAAILAVMVLDSPFSGETGSITPKSMRYSLAVMEHQRALETGSVDAPCTPTGLHVDLNRAG